MPQDQKTYSDLVTAIQKAARFWEADATASAIRAVKEGTKASLMDAKVSVARHDASLELADRIITLVRSHWPGNLP